ncbi:MAG TPA: AraC family transcriptional regulator [Burkholderiaceae bacterium]|nr:AraC family transcriptional regulator [Burkholderiaceae bacterium]
MFAAEGLEVPALFAEVGLDFRALQDPDARFSVDTISQLWELAVARSGKPNLGLNRELAASYGNLDVVGYAMLSSATLLEGFERLARYLAVVSDGATLEVLPDARGHWLVLGHIGTRRPVPRQRVEFGMLTLLMLCNWLSRRELQPLACEFVFPAPTGVERYRETFLCPVRFGQPVNRVLLGSADLQAPIPTRNPALYEVHERLVADRMDHLGQQSTVQRVRNEIAHRLHLGEPRREDVAAALQLTDRTLQRRLQAEANSFQHLLDETRRELAAQYLADKRYALAEVADRLGFVDSSNFFRAAKRWFGVSPGQYRNQLFAEAPTATEAN